MYQTLTIILLLILVFFTLVSIEEIKHRIKKKNTKISFKESMDLLELPVITFYNGNTKLNFLLDTGSNLSYINKSVLHNIIYTPIEGIADCYAHTGEKTKFTSCEIEIQYKKQIYIAEFGIMDLDAAFAEMKSESGVTLHGVLGSKFFETYRYVLDFQELIAYNK